MGYQKSQKVSKIQNETIQRQLQMRMVKKYLKKKIYIFRRKATYHL